jgi:RimJ/RimL family protein N-acetyltransferase
MGIRLPYPYTVTDAKTWYDYICKTEKEHAFAIVAKKKMMGVVGLVHEPEHKRAELGYWLGRQYWNSGYMTSAIEMILGYAFGVLKVNKVYANVFGTNEASKKVLIKNGFYLEGTLKQHCSRMGTLHDLMCFGILKENYDK